MLSIRKFTLVNGSLIYICQIKHNFIVKFLNFLFYGIFPQYLKKSSKKQYYKYTSKIILSYISHCIFFKSSCLSLSFSHSYDKTICASVASSEKVLLGVDIEYIVDNIRPSLLDYVMRSQFYHYDKIDTNVLTIIMFSCMESIYKALSAFITEGFSMGLFEPIKITKTYCDFYVKLSGGNKIVARAMYFIDGKRVISLCCFDKNRCSYVSIMNW